MGTGGGGCGIDEWTLTTGDGLDGPEEEVGGHGKGIPFARTHKTMGSLPALPPKGLVDVM